VTTDAGRPRLNSFAWGDIDQIDVAGWPNRPDLGHETVTKPRGGVKPMTAMITALAPSRGVDPV
jgi:hypothetical protein